MALLEVLTLVLSFVALLALGMPIAYCIGLSATLTLLISVPTLAAFTTMAQRLATGLDSFTLLAIPFFILAGQLMNRGGIARRLVDFAKVLVGALPGGLAFVNIVASMLFGAISGSAVAAASAIGGFMGPRMEREGYDKSYGAAVNITASTTGLIIPPSNILIVYSLASGGVSIAALFLAGYVPGLLVGLVLMLVAGVIAHKNKYPRGERAGLSDAAKKFFQAVPSLLLLVVVIGGIVGGIFTATEASAVAVLYTLILALAYREVKVGELGDILLETVATTSIVLLLVGTSIGLSWVMAYENIPQNVSAALLSISNDIIVVLLIINLILLVVGIFMDMTPAVLIFTPIFLPVVTELGMDPVHFGIVMVLNLCIGLCTPPVGSVLFVGCGVAGLKIQQVLRPLLPLFLALIAALMLVTYIPQLSLWLPQQFGFLGGSSLD
ncbi:TRAP transporter large permease [Exilibacterium tricleocarpae]|uniref:TRAP transporter large permease protein n=1 Tax=Exilibacterium tricleocarpae TaxID=2591008 RepID=A0A545U9W2_9GAMM|nr:TRAP transporter large permease [Exilibacterium tricleocarpae]TQV86219.1 TRAP transporter large permease [Exilibacterium tricleocarpae]